MSMLVDTGVLLRAFDADFVSYRAIRQSLRKALAEDEQLFVTVQNMAEFWNVTTRPLERNGYGLSTDLAKRRVRLIEWACEVLAEDDRSYEEWKRLIDELGVSGVKVHDARLVSVMKSGGIETILTLNASDFRRYAGEGILVLTPEAYLA